MTDMNKIADKIQKLLALADKSRNPSEAEAQVALLKAQKLMAEYNIELSQFSDEKELKYSLESTKVKPNPRNNRLGNIIASSFAVRIIITNSRLAFFGRENNAKAAAAALSFMHKTMEAGMRRICREHGLETTQAGAATWYNPYALGFLQGLKEAMDAQTKALAIVVPEDVNNKFAERFPDRSTYKSKDMQYRHDAEAYSKGKKDGHSALDKRSLPQG